MSQGSAAASEQIRFERRFDPHYGIPIAVAPGVLRLTANNPSGFSFHGTNTYILEGKSLVVIDPGPDDEAHLQSLLGIIGKRSVSHILVTHTHIDHSPLAPRLAEHTGATTVSGGALRPGRLAQAAILDETFGFDTGFVPDVVLVDGEVLDTGATKVEAVHTPGHASNHMAFALAGKGILFSGDHVMGWSTTVVSPPDGSMQDYIASLDKLLERDDILYLPGHGPEITEPRPFVRALRSHRLLREGAILARLQAGDRTVEDIAASLYPTVSVELMPAARHTIWAHLESLAGRGLATAEGEPAIGAIYRPA